MGIDRLAGEKGRLVFLLLLSLTTAFSFQGSRGLFETSEGRYAESSREMAERGTYTEPSLGYRPHWTKPPLTYWAVAAGTGLLGASEWGVRLFHALALVATVGVVYWIGRTAWDPVTGWIAGCVYATAPLAVFGAFTVTTDALLTLWEVAAVGCFVRSAVAQGPGAGRRWTAAMWLFFGIGFLTKGPPALLPLLPLLVWRLGSGRRVALATPAGIGLFFLVGFSWYLWVVSRHPGLLGYFLGEEVVGRVSSDDVHNAEWFKPFTLYLPVIALAVGPWACGWVRGLRGAGGRPFRRFADDLRRGGFVSLAVLWVLVPLVVFSVVKSRLPLYLLPLTAPLALLAACGIRRHRPEGPPLRRVAGIALATAAVLVGAKGVASYVPHADNMAQLYGFMRAFSPGPVSRAASFTGGKKLYGLQYYLDGNLHRVTWTGGERFADESLGTYLTAVAASADERPVLLVAHPKYRVDLHRTFRRYGVSFQEAQGRFWTLFSLSGAAESGASPSRKDAS